MLLLLISIVAASLNSTVMHKAKLHGSGAIYLFNLFSATVWCVCLFIINGCKLSFTQDAVLWGFVYGVVQALFILFKTGAMNSGPVAVTTMIGNCSMLVSVVACLFLWGEPISLADVAGLALLMVGILMTTFKRSNGTFTKKWPVLSFFFLLFAAGVGITFKAFSKSASAQAGDMMLVAAVVMLISYSILCFFTNGFSRMSRGVSKSERLTFVLFALTSGLFSCVYNRMNIFLSGELDGVIFFPSFNGGVVVLSTVLSVILLRERLMARQIVGICMGVVGICIIGIL